MGRPESEPASPSTLAPALFRWIAENGGEVAASTDLDEIAVTPRALAAAFATAAELVAEPHVALRLPHALVLRRYDAVALASHAAATPRDVLGIHARWGAIVLPQLEAEVVDGERAVSFSARFRGHPRGLGLEIEEYLVALVLHRCRRGGAEVSPEHVSFISARPRDLAPIYAALGTREIAFGSERCGIEISLADARRPLPGGDPALVATAEHLATAALAAAPRVGALHDALRAKIDATLPGPVSAEAIATLLHMSPRTLQRRLEAEGTRFSEVLDGVREARARRLLDEGPLPLAEIAHRAGFADLATFSRAFKRWTGLPPGAYRRFRQR